MPNTGVKDALWAAGIVAQTLATLAGFKPKPLSGDTGEKDILTGAECVCVVERSPDPVDVEVLCQSICQRPATPNVVDVSVLLRGDATFSWDDTNSGFSVDGGSNWYALDPKPTGLDIYASDTSVFVVDGERVFNFVLDMDLHLDDFTDQTCVDYLLTFTTA